MRGLLSRKNGVEKVSEDTTVLDLSAQGGHTKKTRNRISRALGPQQKSQHLYFQRSRAKEGSMPIKSAQEMMPCLELS